MLFSLFIGAALAQTPSTVDAHGFYLAPNDGDITDGISTWSAKRQEPMTVAGNFVFEYASHPMTLHRVEDGVETEEDLVSDLTVLNVGLYFAPHERVALTLATPVFLNVRDLSQNSNVGLGDVKLAVPVGLVLPDSNWGLGVSVVPYVVVPGAYDAQSQLGTDGVAGGGLVAATVSHEKVAVSANLGAEFDPEVQLYNLKGKEKLVMKADAAYKLTDHVAVHGGWSFNPSLRNNEFNGTESPMEAQAVLKGQVDDHLGWTLGGAKALNHGVSAATWRAFAGASVKFGKKDDPVCEPCVCEKCPEPTPVPVPTPEPESTVKIENDHLVLMKPIYFDFDKADIRFPDSQQVMTDLVKILEEHPEIALLQVATGTDPRGTTSYNQDLSLRRAYSVMNFLVEHGISQARLTAVGYGESRLPMGTCSTEECYEKDRFAEFSILQMKE